MAKNGSKIHYFGSKFSRGYDPRNLVGLGVYKKVFSFHDKKGLKCKLFSPFSQNFPDENAPRPPSYDSTFTNKRFKILWQKKL